MLVGRCPWYIAGPILGALIVGLRATVNKPLGALGGCIDLAEPAARPSRPIDWNVERPRTRHVAGSMLFTLGWTVAGACPGPVAAMIGGAGWSACRSPWDSSGASRSNACSSRERTSRYTRWHQRRPAYERGTR